MGKKILFILPCLPYPLTTGGHQAMFNGIKACIDSMDVNVVYMAGRNDKLKKEREKMVTEMGGKVEVFPYIGENGRPFTYLWMKKAARKFFAKFYINDKEKIVDDIFEYLPTEEGYIQFINKIIEEKEIDIVQVEMLSQLSLVLSLPSNVKKIFVHHEIGFVRNSLLMNSMNSGCRGMAMTALAEFNEIGLLNKYDGVITLSKVDKEKLREVHLKSPIYSSFAIVDSPYIIKEKCIDPYSLVFVGPESHLPNKIGVMWFLDNCWRQLLNSCNKYTLNVVGSWSESTQSKISSEYHNVNFMGFVDNLGDALTGKIMIVPITIGSGIRMKIMEAANYNVPVVTTNVGVEGLPLTNEVSCLIEDTPRTFVEAITKLQDEDLVRFLVKNAADIVKTRFSLEALKNNRIRIYEEMLNRDSLEKGIKMLHD